MQYTFNNLNADTVTLIIGSLARLPYGESYRVIAMLEAQIKAQDDAANRQALNSAVQAELKRTPAQSLDNS